MSDELKSCPFCGREQHLCPEEIPYTGQLHECGSCNVISYDWNTRPIEDALNARIAELEAHIAALEEAYARKLKSGTTFPIFQNRRR